MWGRGLTKKLWVKGTSFRTSPANAKNRMSLHCIVHLKFLKIKKKWRWCHEWDVFLTFFGLHKSILKIFYFFLKNFNFGIMTQGSKVWYVRKRKKVLILPTLFILYFHKMCYFGNKSKSFCFPFFDVWVWSIWGKTYGFDRFKPCQHPRLWPGLNLLTR